MNLENIVTLFKNHQIQYGLNGDSKFEELYKWELVSKQSGHPDPNAVDFSKEITSLVLAISATVRRLQQLDFLQNLSQKSTGNSLKLYLMKIFFYRKELKNSQIVVRLYGMIRLRQGSVKRQVQCVMNDLSAVS